MNATSRRIISSLDRGVIECSVQDRAGKNPTGDPEPPVGVHYLTPSAERRFREHRYRHEFQRAGRQAPP